ncbi:MAG: radical SAM protein [Promethearchaeota archaeon]
MQIPLEEIIKDAEYVCSYKIEFNDTLGDFQPKKLEPYSMKEIESFYKNNLNEKTISHFNEKYNIWHVFKSSIRSTLRDFPYRPPDRKCPHTMIVNIGRGCLHNCPYCYATAYPWSPPEGIVIYYDNILDVIKKDILDQDLFFKIYLSSSIDCYQPIPEIRNLTEHIFTFLHNAGLSFSITTKSAQITNLLLHLTPESNQSFYLMMTLDVPNEDVKLQRLLSPNASPIKKRIEALKQFHDKGIFTTARLDPLIFGLTTEPEPILKLLDKLSSFTNHIVGSTMRLGRIEKIRLKKALLTLPNGADLIENIDQEYTEKSWSGNYVNLNRAKCEEFHKWLIKEVEARGMTYGVCNELGPTFDSKHAKTCEGSHGCFVKRKVKVPFFQTSDKDINNIVQLKERKMYFKPVIDCYGDCLRSCPDINNPPCGNKELQKNYPFKKSDLVQSL